MTKKTDELNQKLTARIKIGKPNAARLAPKRARSKNSQQGEQFDYDARVLSRLRASGKDCSVWGFGFGFAASMDTFRTKTYHHTVHPKAPPPPPKGD